MLLGNNHINERRRSGFLESFHFSSSYGADSEVFFSLPMAVCPFLRCVVATVVTLERAQLHSLFGKLQKHRTLLVRSQMSCLLFVNGLRSKSFFRVVKIQWHVWSLHSTLRNITRLEKNLQAINLHRPADPPAAAISVQKLSSGTVHSAYAHPKGSCYYMPKLEPCQSSFHLYVCLEVWAVTRMLLPHPGSAFHKSRFYCRLAGGNHKPWLPCKEPSDSNFTIPCVCMLLPLLIPKEQTWWQSVWVYLSTSHHSFLWPTAAVTSASAKWQGEDLRPSGPHRGLRVQEFLCISIFPAFMSSLEKFVASVLFLSHISMF